MTAILFVTVVLLSPTGPLLVSRLVLGCALIVLFMIDLEHQILPNVITLPGIVVGLALSFIAPPGPVDALIGAALGAGVLYAIAAGYYLVRKEEGMGMGDVKMLAMVGAFLGWRAVLLTLILSSFSGAIVGIGLLATSRGSMRYALPFGTFLALGALVAMLSGDAIFTLVSVVFRSAMNPTSWALLGLTAIVGDARGPVDVRGAPLRRGGAPQAA